MRRVIFTLLYDRGNFMLSRNFRLQAVGGVDWLFTNYDFAYVSHGLDELMVLDVSRGERQTDRFCEIVKHISGRCFIPMTVGGGVTSMEIAQKYLHNGADKLLVNTAFQDDLALCCALAERFGRQCIVAGIDFRSAANGQRAVVVGSGAREVKASLTEWVEHLQGNGAGELLFQSVNRDGTGMGLELSVLDAIAPMTTLPCIIMGGVGKASHVIEGLKHPAVDAVATANLFNFIGSTFLEMRRALAKEGLNLAHWSEADFEVLRNKFNKPV